MYVFQGDTCNTVFYPLIKPLLQSKCCLIRGLAYLEREQLGSILLSPQCIWNLAWNEGWSYEEMIDNYDIWKSFLHTYGSQYIIISVGYIMWWCVTIKCNHRDQEVIHTQVFTSNVR